MIEHGDPRGEFIQVQLALEDESRSSVERRKLKRREADLLARHRRAWLGNLYPFFHPAFSASMMQEWMERHPEAPFDLVREEAGNHLFPWLEARGEYQFRRGWLDMLRLDPLDLPARALAQRRRFACCASFSFAMSTRSMTSKGRMCRPI